MSLLLERGHGMSRVYMGKDLFITHCKNQSNREECDEGGMWVTKRLYILLATTLQYSKNGHLPHKSALGVDV